MLVETSVFASAVVLAHLVPPAEFGRAAIALTLAALAVVVAGQGFGTRLVQRETLDREHLEAALTLSVISGVILSGLTLLFGMFAAEALFGARTATLIRLVSPIFLLLSFSVVPQSILQRKLAFARLAGIEAVASIIGAVAGVALAVAGADGEALVGSTLVAAVLTCVFLIASTRAIRPGWHPAAMRDIGAFGTPVVLASIANQGVRNIDYALLGIRLGAAQVGFYFRAFQLGVDYQRKISAIMLRIAFPVFSRSESLDHMRSLRARIVRVHATIIFPLLALLIALAPVGVPWLFGHRWEPAVLPTQVLAVAGMAAAVTTGSGPLVMAAGRPKALVVYNTINAFMYAGLVLLLASWGLTVVCVGVAIYHVLSLLAAQYFLVTRIVHIPFRQLWEDTSAALMGSAALLACSYPLTGLLDRAGAPAPVTIAAVIPVGLAAYVLALRKWAPAAWADMSALRRRVISRPRRTPQPVSAAVGD
jgi:O-antigen/teichoic acid export membrane protein